MPQPFADPNPLGGAEESRAVKKPWVEELPLNTGLRLNHHMNCKSPGASISDMADLELLPSTEMESRKGIAKLDLSKLRSTCASIDSSSPALIGVPQVQSVIHPPMEDNLIDDMVDAIGDVVDRLEMSEREHETVLRQYLPDERTVLDVAVSERRQRAEIYKKLFAELLERLLQKACQRAGQPKGLHEKVTLKAALEGSSNTDLSSQLNEAHHLSDGNPRSTSADTETIAPTPILLAGIEKMETKIISLQAQVLQAIVVQKELPPIPVHEAADPTPYQSSRGRQVMFQLPGSSTSTRESSDEEIFTRESHPKWNVFSRSRLSVISAVKRFTRSRELNEKQKSGRKLLKKARHDTGISRLLSSARQPLDVQAPDLGRNAREA